MAASVAGRALLWTAGEVVNATSKRPHDIGICPAVNAGGVHLVRWIEVISGQCVYGTLGSVSWTFGTLLSQVGIDDKVIYPFYHGFVPSFPRS